MAAGRVNFLIEKGASWHKELTWTDADENPIDITGWSARFQVRDSASSPTIILSLTSDPSGGITLGGALGTIVLDATDEDTSALLGSSGVHALELENSSGDVTRLIQGRVRMSAEVVRDEGLD